MEVENLTNPLDGLPALGVTSVAAELRDGAVCDLVDDRLRHGFNLLLLFGR